MHKIQIKTKDDLWYLTSWLLSENNTICILFGDLDRITSFIKKIKRSVKKKSGGKIKTYSKLSEYTRLISIENNLNSERTIICTDNIENTIRGYLKSISRERSHCSAPPQALSPAEIYKRTQEITCINFDNIDFDFEYFENLKSTMLPDQKIVLEKNNEYIAELMSYYSNPGLFIDHLIQRVRLGEFNYKSHIQVPKHTPIFSVIDKHTDPLNPEIYISVSNILRSWSELFGLRKEFYDIDIKRYCWKISEPCDLYVYNNRHDKYRVIRGQEG